MNPASPESSPAVGSQEIPEADRPRARRRRWRISVAVLMLLIGLIAVGLAVVDHWRRVRYVVYNDRDQAIHNVRLEYGGHQFETAEIAPSEHREWRIPTSLTSKPVRLSWETVDSAPNAVKRHQRMTSLLSDPREGDTFYVRVNPAGHTYGITRR